MKYFVYTHLRDDTNEIFYIGKGKINQGRTPKQIYKRAYTKTSRNTYWKSVTNLTSYSITIVKSFESEIEALAHETFLILQYKTKDLGGKLVNFKIKDNPQENYQKCLTPNLPVIPVHQYNMDGTFKQSFKSLTDASKQTGCNLSNISCTIDHNKKRKIFVVGNYYWSKIKVDMFTIPTQKNYVNNVIQQYDLQGNYIRDWNSAKEAVQTLNLNYCSLRNNLSNTCRTKSCGGYVFKNLQTLSPQNHPR